MTSLALQLKKLALPQNDPNLLTRKDVASLLFDPKDAATMERTTFYALGELRTRTTSRSGFMFLSKLCLSSRVYWAGGAAGNRTGIPGVPGHSV